MSEFTYHQECHIRNLPKTDSQSEGLNGEAEKLLIEALMCCYIRRSTPLDQTLVIRGRRYLYITLLTVSCNKDNDFRITVLSVSRNEDVCF
jgi:hypothetical protein